MVDIQQRVPHFLSATLVMESKGVLFYLLIFLFRYIKFGGGPGYVTSKFSLCYVHIEAKEPKRFWVSGPQCVPASYCTKII